jgi:hypothetical protein
MTTFGSSTILADIVIGIDLLSVLAVDVGGNYGDTLLNPSGGIRSSMDTRSP